VVKVAVCGGSGSFLLNDAIKAKADVFVTSDFKYHQFFDADNKIVIVDIGHFEGEICTQELIYDYLSEKFITFDSHFSKVNTNPINYL
jgi:putative NIF3 family GTP cyclohydrolase 1 type 2